MKELFLFLLFPSIIFSQTPSHWYSPEKLISLACDSSLVYSKCLSETDVCNENKEMWKYTSNEDRHSKKIYDCKNGKQLFSGPYIKYSSAYYTIVKIEKGVMHGQIISISKTHYEMNVITRLVLIGNYNMGKEDDEWRYFDKEGELIGSRLYEKGNIIDCKGTVLKCHDFPLAHDVKCRLEWLRCD